MSNFRFQGRQTTTDQLAPRRVLQAKTGSIRHWSRRFATTKAFPATGPFAATEARWLQFNSYIGLRVDGHFLVRWP
jgi:hypothetical protein